MSQANAKTCFVVMPMSDSDGYQGGHWDRVYNELFVPACTAAEFEPDRADSKKSTALIMADVLRRLHRADMVLCDLSALRPNVMFELGLRQAFDQPVVLVLDERTARPFDTSQLRDFTYDSSLRVDLVRAKTAELATALRDTYAKRVTGDYSLVRLLEIGVAQPPKPASGDSAARAMFASILGALDRLSADVSTLKRVSLPTGGFSYPFGTSAAAGFTSIAENPRFIGATGIPAGIPGFAGAPSSGLLSSGGTPLPLRDDVQSANRPRQGGK